MKNAESKRASERSTTHEKNKKMMKIRDESSSNESRNRKKEFYKINSVLFHFKNVDEQD